jgi:AsmA protein
MSRVLKIVGILVGVIVVLIVGVIVAVTLLFDPNDYKSQITDAVAQATGRTLTLEGDLGLDFFPRIAVAVGAASLSNAEGFGDAPFARIESARISLEILPLIFGSVSIGEVSLDGLRLSLARNARGVNNWQDLGGSASSPPAGAAPAEGASAPVSSGEVDLGVGSLRITDAEVSWSDASTGSDWMLTGFDFEASDFGLGKSFPLSIAFNLAGTEIEVAVESEMNATLALAENTYRLDGLEVTIDGSGTGWPGGEGQATLAFDSFAANLDAETVDLTNLRLRLLGLAISGTLQGRELFSDLSLAGAIDIAEFNPDELIERFGAAIETADPEVFRRASAHADFLYDSSQMGMRNMRFMLDDSELTGSIGMQGETLRFDLDVNAINIDRYLPPAAEPSETAEAGEGSVDEIDLPLEPLRTFTANGTLSLGETQFMNLTLTDAEFGLTAGDGRLWLTPSGNLYGGTVRGRIGIEVQGDAARLSLVQNLSNVDLNGLARDFLATEDLSGKGNVSLDLAAVGSNVGAVRRDLDGTASFTLRDGAWEGIDAWYELRRARAVLDRAPTPAREGEPRTTFSNVSATGMVTDAVLTTDDLNATLPFMALNGGGTVNLLTDEIDFDVTASFVDGPVLQSDPAMARMVNQRLPLNVGGTLGAPTILPNFSAMVREELREEVNEAVEERKSEVEQQIDQEREEAQDRLRDRLRRAIER